MNLVTILFREKKPWTNINQTFLQYEIFGIKGANMNPKLYVQDTATCTYRVLQYNVDQAVREEGYKATEWNSRKHAIRKLILSIDADVICLQELRQLPKVDESPEEFLAGLCGKTYRFVIDYRNATTLSFGQAILYKISKFYAIKHTTKWLSATPDVCSDPSNGFGYIVNSLCLHPVQNGLLVYGADPITVFNTHFGLDEGLKTNSCYWLKDIVSGTAFHNFVVCGDFNFFSDRDGNSQRAILADVWQDLGKGATYTGVSKTHEGTFIGYAHDEFKSQLTNLTSRLDHICSSRDGVEKIGEAQVLVKTMSEEIDKTGELDEFRRYPSDHFPLVVDIRVVH